VLLEGKNNFVQIPFIILGLAFRNALQGKAATSLR
jgi:hypothetical protein